MYLTEGIIKVCTEERCSHSIVIFMGFPLSLQKWNDSLISLRTGPLQPLSYILTRTSRWCPLLSSKWVWMLYNSPFCWQEMFHSVAEVPNSFGIDFDGFVIYEILIVCVSFSCGPFYLYLMCCRLCAYCSFGGAGVCAQCKSVRYCGRRCQQVH